MRREIPLALTFLLGTFFIADNFVNKTLDTGWSEGWATLAEKLQAWVFIIIAFTYILGVGNVLRIHLRKIALKQTDWQYSIWTVVGLLGMLAVGFVGSFAHHVQVRGNAPPDTAIKIFVDDSPAGEAKADKVGEWRIEVSDDTIERRLAVANPPLTLTLDDEPAPSDAMDALRVTKATPLLLGSGAIYDWVYDAVYTPMQSTMFALLAFYISSAAFRAFRIRSLSAGLLAVTALVVILGRVPLGEKLWENFPTLVEWVMSYLQNAGKRAILIGAALGAISTGIKMILGVERTYLSGD